MGKRRHNGTPAPGKRLLHNRAETKLYEGPIGARELDRLWRTGQLPLVIGMALDVGRAAGVALHLPPVGPERQDGTPTGYGVLPPEGAEPLVTLRAGVVDRFGEPVPRRAQGILGAIWRNSRRPDRLVFRVWFRHDTGWRPDGQEDRAGSFRLVDTYDDTIASVRGLGGELPHLTGWQIARLDGAPPEEGN